MSATFSSPLVQSVAEWARSYTRAGYLVWLLVWASPVLVGQWLAFPGFLARTLPRWLPTALLLAACFGAADAIGIASGVWRISDDYTLGLRLGGVLPVEEALFFLLTTLMVAQTVALFLWRFGDLPGEPWPGWSRAFLRGR
ncbi:MAG: lycopene cyclase domain-containing protein [Alphaproteobacteria bacterium]